MNKYCSKRTASTEAITITTTTTKRKIFKYFLHRQSEQFTFQFVFFSFYICANFRFTKNFILRLNFDTIFLIFDGNHKKNFNSLTIYPFIKQSKNEGLKSNWFKCPVCICVRVKKLLLTNFIMYEWGGREWFQLTHYLFALFICMLLLHSVYNFEIGSRWISKPNYNWMIK